MNIPNRVHIGKKGAGQFDHKRNSESDIELESDVPAPVERPQNVLTDFAMQSLNLAAENYRAAGEEVPEGLQEAIDEANEKRAQLAAWRQAQKPVAAPVYLPAPEPPVAPEPVVHDLTTDEGRLASVEDEEKKMNDLLAKSNEAKADVRNADYAISDLRKESYKGISFDIQRLQEEAQPLRDASREAEEAYIRQRRVWDAAREYANSNLSQEAQDRKDQLAAARTNVVEAKSRLTLLIHSGADEAEKEAARQEWRAAHTSFMALKGE